MSQTAPCLAASDLGDNSAGAPWTPTVDGVNPAGATYGSSASAESNTIRFTMDTNNFSLAGDCGGVIVKITWHKDNGFTPPGDATDIRVRLTSGGSQVGTDDKATLTQLPTTDTEVDYGDTADVWGYGGNIPGVTVNDGTFGVDIRVSTGDPNDNVQISRVDIEVFDSGGLDVIVDPAMEVPFLGRRNDQRSTVARIAAEGSGKVDPAAMTQPEAPHSELFAKMFVPRGPNPLRKPWQWPMMGSPDPASFTLPDAPEPLHPENYPMAVYLPNPPKVRHAWQFPIMASTDYTGLLTAESAHPEAMRQMAVEVPPRQRARQYQPPMGVLDPGALSASEEPVGFDRKFAELPPRQRSRIVLPPIDNSYFVPATPGDPSVYPDQFQMCTPQRAFVKERRQPSAGRLVIDAWSSTQTVQPSMAVPVRGPRRPNQLPIQSGDTAPQYFEDQQIIGWQVPLGMSARSRRPVQNVQMAGEISGETLDLALIEPSAWQSNAPAIISRRVAGCVPPVELPANNPPVGNEPAGWQSPLSQPIRRPATRTPRNEALLPFTEITTSDTTFLESMRDPLGQPRKAARHAPDVGPIYVAAVPTEIIYDWQAPISQPMPQPRAELRQPVETATFDSSALAPPTTAIGPMQGPPPRRRRGNEVLAAPNIVVPLDPLRAAVDFLAMSGTPPVRHAVQQPGGNLVIVPEAATTPVVPDPMASPIVHRPPAAQQKPPAFTVDQQYFGEVVMPASYEPMRHAMPLPRHKLPPQSLSDPLTEAPTSFQVLAGLSSMDCAIHPLPPRQQPAPVVTPLGSLLTPSVPAMMDNSAALMPRRKPLAQRIGEVIVSPANFPVPDPSAYAAPWIVPARRPQIEPRPIQQELSPMSFIATATPTTFAGSGAFVVVRGAIYSLNPVAGKIVGGNVGL